MAVRSTSIDGLLVIDHPVIDDERGFFHQTWQSSELKELLDPPPEFVQGNHARSHPGVLRGFHAEPWDKLVYVASGRVQAVVVDLRPRSPTFAAHESFLLGDDAERVRLFLTAGLGNGYLVVGDEPTDYLYDVTAEYRPDVDRRDVAWDDPDLAVDWLVTHPIVSAADRMAPSLRERFPTHSRFDEAAGA